MWTAEDIPDLSGKVAVVTGANSGIGFETAKALGLKNAQVILACRSLERGEKALKGLFLGCPEAKAELLHLDLASLYSVRRFSEKFEEEHARLDILVNNAGVMALPERRETVDGFEMHFGVNHLGHFALTGLLMDGIKASSGARVVNVSSMAHRQGRVDFNNLNSELSYDRWGAYRLSKLANLLFTYELQRRFESSGVDAVSVAAHPGWTATNLQRNVGLFRVLNPLLGQKPHMGALPTLYAATAEDVKGGEYVGPGGFMEMRGHPRKVESNKASHDVDVARRLWRVSEEMTGVGYSL
ncbi:MAG: SDR family NAD(P)-dependent oxidoreductase [Candidatus Altiarchaeales archaeon]|nr:SDR family NAD(P)-dependent oxidoreductase [Candidatus Altiarchaeales archaeon]MBD3417004.1 SDR family NAD(P)-dependent oxidoreductase [Candidatus Altiarchaeales archaeon]